MAADSQVLEEFFEHATNECFIKCFLLITALPHNENFDKRIQLTGDSL